MQLIISATRDHYYTDKIRTKTMTVGQLIEWLEEVSEGDYNLPVFIGNDRKNYGWYTFGAITEESLVLVDNNETEEE